MNDKLRIAIADGNTNVRSLLREVLGRLGHDVVADVADADELVEAMCQSAPDLAIVEIRGQEEPDGVAGFVEVATRHDIALICMSSRTDPASIDFANRCGAVAYLVQPLRESDLGPAISIAMHRSEELRALRRNVESLQQALDDRKIIERAKGLVMLRDGLPEATAFRQLQKTARHNRMKLVDIARRVLNADELAGHPN
jgi:response regulator NasT